MPRLYGVFYMDFTVKQRKKIGYAISLLRKVYEIESSAIASKVKYSRCHQLHIENGTTPPSDIAISRYADYFKLNPETLLTIGIQCNSLIDTFKYLQSLGRI